MRALRLLPVLLAALLVLVGCAGGDGSTTPRGAAKDSPTEDSTPVRTVHRYVALGDSYTAAPYVPITDVAGGCLRSDHNYPALLEKSLRPSSFADVSCSAAKVADLSGTQRTLTGSARPQLTAVTADTDLVTLGIGGNDENLFATLSAGCPVTGPDGVRISGGRSGRIDVGAAEHAVAAVGRNVRTGLAEVRRKAPHATVVLVGYPRIASTVRTCPARLPMSREAARAADSVTRLLSRTLRAAAHAEKATYVDMYAASAGHDVCSASPWVNGVKTDTGRALALHPLAAEQQAVADQVVAALS